MRIDAGGGKEGRREFFDDLYHAARAKSADLYDELDRHFEQYCGSTALDGATEEASVVRNITYELIESQVSSYIPTVKVTAEALGDEGVRRARSIERLAANIRDRLPFEELNDLDERYTYVYGGSVWLVEWDNSIQTHDSVGGIKISVVPPYKFTGQPGIYNVDDMEYCFIEYDTTRDDLVRRYDVSYEVADATESDEHEDDDLATVIVCFYKNDEGKICQFIWSGDQTLADIDDYYSRKIRYCTICGKREELCECDELGTAEVQAPGTEGEELDEELVTIEEGETEGGKRGEANKSRFELRNEDYELLDHDIKLSNDKIIPKTTVVRDAHGMPIEEAVSVDVIGTNGMPVLDDVGGVMMPRTKKKKQLKKEPTKLPFYSLDVFPIVIRRNTSREKCIFGQSDCEFIRPQQQAINKVESRIVKKLMRSGVIPLVPDAHEGDVTNQILEMAVKVAEGHKSDYDVWDLTPDISRDIAEADRLYEQAKRILGISSSYQGQHDASAQSGKAKELQIQQAEGRLTSKKKMKHAAYARIYEIMWKYHLAYADEPRPLPYRDSLGRLQGEKFNRYDFLKCDELGIWYYDDAYTFAADASHDMERLREQLWEQILGNLKNGAYGDPAAPATMVIYWLNLERAGYPFAHENVEYFQAMSEQANTTAQLEEENMALRDELNMEKAYDEYVKLYKNAKSAARNGAPATAQAGKGGNA